MFMLHLNTILSILEVGNFHAFFAAKFNENFVLIFRFSLTQIVSLCFVVEEIERESNEDDDKM